ncbi:MULTISPECIES: DNA recombination protein RmuC [Streptococcus]|jgi:DNA recombination protein RmuC|uniref:Competence-induced protein Ccs50 n=3 Tax=Streptococcus gordonii TaxID=1302 RepID=A8AUR0_STRGC|nr:MULTISPECIES: DNA recombination protein RmuC [Streptococcus]ABV09249.1 competence-induced protein Ccs50 [Streptococcus gordonii str. Challis substr. CH1]KJQ65992.1 RmuC family protein [Streptococcus gordonii]MBS6245165.1 DNA recombination protein RmuC [Streptococcus sp.]MBZ2138720.1 DNA recombination protein RmuC [Streptococcus gordonii]MCY7138208.1 DNA recombination protein RmuC [Streptococcus gordonii]
MEILIIILLVANLLLTFLLWQSQTQQKKDVQEILEAQADHLSDQLDYRLEQERQNSLLQQKNLEIGLGDRFSSLHTSLHRDLTDLRAEISDNLTKNRDKTDERMKQIQESNELRLEQMRQTVEEKLEKTLQTRLQTSFESVSKQLESVNRGLGEMQHIARDVGTLNKVLSNTKTRGIMGELQLGQIIEDILTPSQYEREFATVSGSSERVEYAVKLPGQTDQDYVYLPIDSKFPLADYYRLEDAYESGNKEEIELYRKALLNSVKRFAKDIRSKYLAPPATTNFGIMFLPTEGLYSEVVRNPEFFDNLRREEQIVVAGPSTLSALLNSLSVGFKTLNIQKSADDISKVLGSVKLEFNKFAGILVKAQKHLQHASGNIDDLLTRRTNAIERTLRQIELSDDDLHIDLLDVPEEREDHEN